MASTSCFPTSTRAWTPDSLDLELLGAETDRPEDAESARLADRDDHITTAREREDREVDASCCCDRRKWNVF
jgi:hypothetical protein